MMRVAETSACWPVSWHMSDWRPYLPLAAAVMALMAALVHAPSTSSIAPLSRMLSINLKALAAPSPASVPQVKPTPDQPELKKEIITQPAARETINRKKPVTEANPSPAHTTISGNDNGKDTSTVIHEAAYRRQTPPAYPSRAVELGQQGTVTLHAEILPSGQPRGLKIVASSGYRLLDNAALAAVRQWEFIPTEVNGQAITSWVKVPVRFMLN